VFRTNEEILGPHRRCFPEGFCTREEKPKLWLSRRGHGLVRETRGIVGTLAVGRHGGWGEKEREVNNALLWVGGKNRGEKRPGQVSNGVPFLKKQGERAWGR